MVDFSFLICGHSHIVALGVPLATSDSSVKIVKLEHPSGIFEGLAGPWPRDERYWQELQNLASRRTMAIFWQGNYHQAFFLFAPAGSFDFVLSSDTDIPVDLGSTLLPEEALRVRFLPTFGELHSILDSLKLHKDSNVIVCGTPPPKGDEGKVRSMLLKERHFIDLAKHAGFDLATVPLSPPRLQYKLWKLTQNMLEEVARLHGAEFLKVPNDVQDPHGFLREEFYYDTTHANFSYGALFLSHIHKKYCD